MRRDPQPTAEDNNPLAARQAIAATLLKHHVRLWPRLLANLSRLQRLPRNWRRRIARKAAVSLAGAALLLSLGRVPITHAATIDVNGVGCTLEDAIRSANTNNSYGTCNSGVGADIIRLQGDITLTSSSGVYYYGETALPLITSPITIEGNGHTIERDSSDKFRLMAVSSSGDLTLNNVTLSGGYGYQFNEVPAPYNPGYYYNYFYGNGGAIYSSGRLTITNSEISGNEARYSGGAISGYNGVISISNSEISGNTAGRGGAIYHDYATVTILNSVLNDNIALEDGGGAIYNDEGELTIRNSTLSGNKSYDDDGGAIYNDFGTTIIHQSVISHNNAYEQSGGGLFDYDGTVVIENSVISYNIAANGAGLYGIGTEVRISRSTISYNRAYSNSYGYYGHGGGLHNEFGQVDIINSTISHNTADGRGGGLYNNVGDVFIINSTIANNTADERGGGVYQWGGDARLNLIRSIVSFNNAPAGSELFIRVNNTATANNRNVLGRGGMLSTTAFHNFSPGATDTNATSDGTNTPITSILNTALAPNGALEAGATGETAPLLNHALVSGSPAIDKAPNNACNNVPVNGVDQRGYGRNADGNGIDSTTECDAGAFEYGATPVVEEAALFMTAAGPGSTNNGVNFGKEDILFWDGSAWSLFFDGSAAGLKSGTKGHDVNAIHVNAADDLYLSFFQNKIKTTNLGQVFGTDILHWNGSDLEYFFDGSDVGLDKVAQEKIDALHILDGALSPVEGNCQAYLLISTFGTGQVPAANGGMLKFQGEDILGFCLSNPGLDTQGFWHMVLDGSTQGMPKNSTDSISASDDGEVIYLTTRGAFNVDSASGSDSQVYRYDTVSGTFSGPLFTAADNGLNKKVDGLHLTGSIE